MTQTREQRIDSLQRGRAKLLELRRLGAAPPAAQVRRAPALKRYFRDMEGVLDPHGDPRRSSADQSMIECRRYALEAYRRALALHGTLKRAVEAACYDCVGGGADPGPKLAVRDCPCQNCPLHAVRPWKALKGRR